MDFLTVRKLASQCLHPRLLIQAKFEQSVMKSFEVRDIELVPWCFELGYVVMKADVDDNVKGGEVIQTS